MKIKNFIAAAAILTLPILIGNHALAQWEPAPDPAVTALITPQSKISVGTEFIFDDASRFGEYNGKHENGIQFVLDLDLINRDEKTGTWIGLTARNLGLDNRELRFENERQGNWTYFVDFSQTPKVNSLTINTGLTGIGTNSQAVAGTALRDVELETERDRLKLGFEKHFGRGFDVKVAFSREEKEGARQWGAQGVSPDFNFLTEPIDFVHDEINAQLSFKSPRLQISGGYLGSFFSNENKVLANDSNQAEIALPLDNQAHQLFLTGGYSLTPTTRGTFKLSHGRTYQDDDYFRTATFGGNNSTSLDAEVWNTLAQLGLSSRPLKGLSVNVKLRYQDRDDKTPRKQYITADATTDGFNNPISRSTSTADLQIGYQLPLKIRLTGGFEFEHWDRSIVPIRQTSHRRTTDEYSFRIKLRRSLSETLAGSIGYLYGDRTGSDYQPVGSSTQVIDPIFAADRERNKGRLTLDWVPTDRFSIQGVSEYTLDQFNGRTLGPRDGSTYLVSIDANYKIADEWNLSTWISHSNTNMDMATNCSSFGECGNVVNAADWVADLDQSNSAVGLGLRGMVTDNIKVSIDTQFSIDESEYEIETIGGAPLSDLPDITYKNFTINLSAEYSISKFSSLQFKYGYDWTIADDWTWKGWTYADGTTVTIPSKQDTHFIGITYKHRF